MVFEDWLERREMPSPIKIAMIDNEPPKTVVNKVDKGILGSDYRAES